MRSAPRSARFILITGGGMLLAAIVYAVFVLIPKDHARAIENWRVQLDLTATDRQLVAERTIKRLLADVQTYASYPTAALLASQEPRPQARNWDARTHLHDLLLNASAYEHLSTAALVNRAGHVLVVAGASDSATLRQVAQTAASVMTSGEPALQTSTQARTSEMYFAAPVPTRSTESVKAAMVIAVDATRELFPYVTPQWMESRTAETIVAADLGDSVMLLTARRKRRNAASAVIHDKRVASSAVLRAQRGFGEYFDYAGDRVFAAGRQIKGTNWAVIVKIDRQEALHDFKGETASLGLMLLALIAAAFAAVYGMASRLRARHTLELARESERRASADEELRHSYALMHSVTETTTDAIFVKDLNHRFVYANSACARVLNTTAEQLIGKRNDEILPASLASVFDRFDDAALASATPIRREQTLNTPDGELTMLVIGSPLFDDHGQVKGLTGSARDITELQAAKARFRSMFDNAAVGIATASAEGILIDVNHKLAEILGYEVHELQGMSIAAVTAPDQRVAERKWLKEHPRRRNDIFDREKQYLRKDGRIVRARVGGTLIRKPNGEPDYFLAMIEDISAQYEAEHALKETRERLEQLSQRARALLDANVVGIAIGTVDGAIVEANDYYLDMVGYSRVELDAGEVRWIDMTPPEHLAADYKAIEELRVKGWSAPYEKEYVRKDGSRVWVLMGDTMLTGPGEQILTYAVNVTAQKELEQQYLHAQKLEAVGRLAGGVAHDFNNILTAIHGTVALAVDELPQNDPIRNDLEEISGYADRATALTRQLLAFSRRQVMQPRTFDLRELIEQSERMLRRIIGEDVELEIQLSEEMLTVHADHAQIEQVILNLVVNARDAMPHGGRLGVSAQKLAPEELPAGKLQRSGPAVMLSVSDTGSGMTEEVLARIFEPFFTTKEHGKGTGLGLATAYGIIQQSHGAVDVTSTPQVGTTFMIYLPWVESETASIVQEPAPVPAAARGVVLLVEDDDGVRSLARRAIQRKGHRVVEARNAAEALLFAEQGFQELHVVVTDIVMPGMSGHELVRRLRHRYGDIEAIFMSGYSADAVDGVHDLGGTFIEKPFTPAQLVNVVNQTLTGLARGRRGGRAPAVVRTGNLS